MKSLTRVLQQKKIMEINYLFRILWLAQMV